MNKSTLVMKVKVRQRNQHHDKAKKRNARKLQKCVIQSGASDVICCKMFAVMTGELTEVLTAVCSKCECTHPLFPV